MLLSYATSKSRGNEEQLSFFQLTFFCADRLESWVPFPSLCWLPDLFYTCAYVLSQSHTCKRIGFLVGIRHSQAFLASLYFREKQIPSETFLPSALYKVTCPSGER